MCITFSFRVVDIAIDVASLAQEKLLTVVCEVFLMFGYLKSFTRVPFPFLVFIVFA